MQHRCKFECVEGLSPEISASLASLEESLHVRWYIGIFLGHKVVQNLCKFSFVWTLRFRFPCVSWSAIARAFLLALSWATRLFLAIKQHSCATSWHAGIGVYARDAALLVSLGAPLHVPCYYYYYYFFFFVFVLDQMVVLGHQASLFVPSGSKFEYGLCALRFSIICCARAGCSAIRPTVVP